ncbi:MAG: hypothetical protein A2Z71_01880 [Chloroflexi bacterium RBG_13_50_21]|nr:MAG: hypothetical protein A2Z71_01880 [Chloroflexi bacterium RBG_13_50_21]
MPAYLQGWDVTIATTPQPGVVVASTWHILPLVVKRTALIMKVHPAVNATPPVYLLRHASVAMTAIILVMVKEVGEGMINSLVKSYILI